MNHLSMTIKAAEPNAKVYQAVAWSGDTKDRSGETFDADTFDLSVLDRHPLPLLFAHDHKQVAGTIKRAWVEGNDLMIAFTLADTALGKDMASLIASGALNTVSVGFIAREAADGVVSRELLEVSLVSVPMNQNAVITERSIPNFNGDNQMSQGPALVRTKSEQETYSLSRFILGLSDPISAKAAGYEFEVSRELARLAGKSQNSAMVPWALLSTKSQDSTTTTTPDTGFSLSQPVTDNSRLFGLASATFKSALAARAGVTFHQAPTTSEFKIPRMVSTVSTDFVQRDSALGLSDATFDTISAFPRTVGGMTRIMRSALIDASPSMEALILGELRKAISNSIDDAFLGQVTPTNLNAPQGLLQTLTGSATEVGAIEDAAALLAMIRSQQVVDDSGTLRLISGHGFTSWANTMPVGSQLNQSPLMGPDAQRIYGTDVSVATSAKLDVDASGALVQTIPVILGQFNFAHLVTFGPGVEIGTNAFASEEWNRGSILCRVMTDIDFINTDPSRFSIGNIAVGAGVK